MNYTKIVLASLIGMLSFGTVLGDASPEFYTLENFPGATPLPTSNGVETIASKSVKMPNSITPTITVGNAKAGTTIECEGWTVQQLLEEILSKDIEPTVVNPSITALNLSFSPSSPVEVGTVVTPSYSITAGLGSYSYGVLGTTGSTATGCSWSQFVITKNDGTTVTKTTTSGNLDTVTVTDDTSFYLTKVVGSYTAGGTPQTYKHKTASVSAIAAGTSTKNTGATSGLYGYRQYFVYIGDKSSTLNSELFRSVPAAQRGNARSTSSIVKNITLGANVTRIAVAIPSDSSHTNFKYTKALKKAKNLTTGYDEFGYFVKQSSKVSILGATTTSASMDYDVYVWDRGDIEGPIETGSSFELTIE